ncbi:thioredoxin reductase [Candidatus Micrarchaeota archaeon CG08_land_8_20_14_0_20_49_17]|nr:MAG: hypothetical protein AUJ13_05175 [Candidatus Micrarchaeota archaeon CG1_02_49_24]PIU09222.1 MAG: thioredoxin reductase [Candidatus Micrarchaeota archaeon CG08_land_8_20_14_0_20_49_17]HII53753.1 FAD-dependent oxidoreductase [Candidatus Micrarchaeota archaeon]
MAAENETHEPGGAGYDVAVVGAGSSGLTAAIYAARKGLKTVLVSADLGGQIAYTERIENYPGFPEGISGTELMQKFERQAMDAGAEIAYKKVKKIDKTEKGFTLAAVDANLIINARSVILAFGKTPRTLGIPNEDKFFGRGISTCTTCDARLYKNKIAGVVGNGNSAIDAARELAEIGAKKVHMFFRGKSPGPDAVIASLREHLGSGKIEFVENSLPVEIMGDAFVTGVVAENIGTKQKRTVELNGMFLELGFFTDTSFVKELVKLDAKGQIIADADGNTGTPGLYAVGDVTNTPYKQLVVAAGSGARAALHAYGYLTNKPVAADYGKRPEAAKN